AKSQEWIPDPAEFITVKDVEWLIGEWSAKNGDAEASVTYGWDEDKMFLRGRYVLKNNGKLTRSGTQIIGKNSDGGLPPWVFDSTGSYGESVWTHDEGRWVIEASGKLPDGNEVTAVNLLVPLGRDAFTWQATERFVGGASLPGTPPVRVTRVKNSK